MGTTGILAAAKSAGTADIVLLCLFYGVLGYGFARMTRRAIGTTPWRIPALVWGAVSGILPILGLLIEMIARLTTRHASPIPGSAHRFDPYLDVHPTPHYLPGATAPPAETGLPWSPQVAGRPGPGGWLPSPPGTPSAPPPLFGWYPDPDGRHEERYWDGRCWADHVRDGGTVTNDPLPAWRNADPTPPWQAASEPGPAGT